MREDQIPSYDQGLYSETCEICNLETRIRTQEYSIYCEYMANVYVECTCGNFIHFKISVN